MPASRSLTFVLAAAVALSGCSPGFLSLEGTGKPSTPGTPTTPTNATFTFAGRVINLQTGAAISGASVTVGSTNTTSGGDGGFTATIGASASNVSVSAPGFLTRTTKIAGGANRSPTIDLISTAAPFDLDYFDRLARGKEQTTVFPNFVLRWPQSPNFIVITKFTQQDSTGAYVSTDQDLPAAVLSRILSTIPSIVPAVTGGRVSAGAIVTRPDARAQVEPGYIQVELANRAGGLANDLCGFGGVNITLLNGNETERTGFARLYNATNCRCGTDQAPAWLIAHEVGHALGFGHTMPYNDSIMSYTLTNPCGNTQFTARDRYHGSIAYARPLGNTTPDNDGDFFQLQRLGIQERRMEFSCLMPSQ